MVDKTNGKFGKNEPSVHRDPGQIILCVNSWVCIPCDPQAALQAARFPFYVVLMVYCT